MAQLASSCVRSIRNSELMRNHHNGPNLEISAAPYFLCLRPPPFAKVGHPRLNDNRTEPLLGAVFVGGRWQVDC